MRPLPFCRYVQLQICEPKRLCNSRSFPTNICREHSTTVEENADHVALQGNLLAEGVLAMLGLYDGDGLQA